MIAYNLDAEMKKFIVLIQRLFFCLKSSLQTSKQSRSIYRSNGFFRKDALVFTLAVSFTEAILEGLLNFRCTSKGIAWRFVVLIIFILQRTI
jgi:hypothetical protein